MANDPKIIIDAHSHVFDFRYVPVCDLILRLLFNWVVDIIARGLAKIVKSILKQRDEMAWADDRFDVGGADLVDAIIDSVPEEVLRDEDVVAAMDYIESEIVAGEVGWTPGRPSYSKLDPDDEAGLRQRAKENLVVYFQVSTWGVRGALQFVGLMLTNETRIFKHLSQEAYSKVDLFVHYMLDLDCHYSGTAKWRFPDEHIDRIAKLVKQSDGRLLAFIPFDPWRPGSLEKVVKKAIEERGFCGVKFYPPSGYRPILNKDAPEVGLSKGEIDARCRKLFEYCADSGIPIVTHCTPDGLEAGPKFGENSDPYYWHELLKSHKGLRKKLRVMFAHSGGNKAWFADSSSNDEFMNPEWSEKTPYGGKVFDLCTTDSDANIYCDTSYLDMILKPDNHSIYANRLKALLKKKPDFAKKMIYGSDYHVLMVQSHYERFLDCFLSVFDDPELEKYRADVFAGNAVRFLNLGGYLARVKDKGVLSKKGIAHLQRIVDRVG